jgi:hypothetical protein
MVKSVSLVKPRKLCPEIIYEESSEADKKLYNQWFDWSEATGQLISYKKVCPTDPGVIIGPGSSELNMNKFSKSGKEFKGRKKVIFGDEAYRNRSVCFTFYANHHNIPKINHMDLWDYMIFGMELCPSDGRMHFQGYVYFKEANSKNSAGELFKNEWGKSAHCTVCNGTPEHNRAYCSKSGIVYEWGRFPNSAGSKRLDQLTEQLINREITVRDIVLNDPLVYHTFGRTLEKIEDEVKYNRTIYRTWTTTCSYYFGAAGLGKSKLWKKKFNPKTHYPLEDQFFIKDWWDGYTNQKIIVIDELEPNTLKSRTLKRMVDEGPYDITIRGKEQIPFLGKHVIITSCLHPKDLYKDWPGGWRQWTRRIKTFKFNKFGEYHEIDIENKDEKISRTYTTLLNEEKDGIKFNEKILMKEMFYILKSHYVNIKYKKWKKENKNKIIINPLDNII